MPESAKRYSGPKSAAKLHKKQFVPRGKTAERGYGGQWQRARLIHLQSHPLCAECERHGHTTEATVVDHITPHRGNPELFWDAAGNWESLCAACHNRKTGKGQ